MKRADYNRLRHYRSAECCGNCGNKEDIGEECGEPPLKLLHCVEMTVKKVDDIRINKNFVCNYWRPE